MERVEPIIMMRLAPSAGGGERVRRSRRVRWERPMLMERCSRRGWRIGGGFDGRGGMS